MKYTNSSANIVSLNENEIFVFGSNLAGRHGLGAAKLAKERFGAKSGIGIGPTGRCYAIPTKNQSIQTLHLDLISGHVSDFIEYAKSNSHQVFLVSRIGCGLAGYCESEIAPMFSEALKLPNIYLPVEFTDLLNTVSKPRSCEL